MARCSPSDSVGGFDYSDFVEPVPEEVEELGGTFSLSLAGRAAVDLDYLYPVYDSRHGDLAIGRVI